MELNARKQLSNYLDEELVRLKSEGFYKPERIIASPQAGEIAMSNGAKVLNFCANNYLGLADNRGLIQAAKAALDRYGYGVASVRFICGTQVEHKLLEKKISDFLRMEAAILYSSCFDANAGLFETLFDESDAIISDQLNHASIIDGLRLCKARKLRYSNNNMEDLEGKLRECARFRFRLIVTDGVFSMDGIITNLKEICTLEQWQIQRQRRDGARCEADHQIAASPGDGAKCGLCQCAAHRVVDDVRSPPIGQ